MRYLWSGAAAATLILGALGGCATSPHYPIDASQTPGPAPLTAPRPQYPIDMPTQDASAAPSALSAGAPAAAAVPANDPTPAGPPASAPVSTVESQSLPPPAGAPAPAPAAPSGGTLQPATVSTVPGASAPAAAEPAVTAAPTPPEPSLTPQTVTHDGAAPPAGHAPIVEASATPPPAPVRTTQMAGYAASGDVVDAGGSIFENYEVQRGDHIDALARAFTTSRDTLLQANDIRAPYVIRPGQIIKVPVAKAYVVVSGDTLTEVARRFSVSPAELADLNHVSQYAALRPGSRLGLPSSMRDVGPVRVETSYAYNGGYHGYEPPQPHGYTPSPPQAPGHHLTEVTPASPSLTPEHPSNYAANPPAGATAQAAFNMSDSQLQQAAHGRFIWPVRGDILERFGPQGVGRRNDGVDIKAPQGSTVAAAAPGEVVYAGDQVPGFGNLVLIKHADGWVTAYAHLDQINVQMKQEVSQGQALGSVGSSGGAPQPELHFEIRYAPTPADKAKPVDPVLVLPNG